MRSKSSFSILSRLLLLITLLSLAGCGGGDSSSGTGGSAGGSTGRRAFLSMGTAPVGGAFNVVGGAIAEVLNEQKGDNNWKVQAKGTKGSQANIRGLSDGKLQLALSNSAISYFAARGESSWDKKYDIRAIVTLAPNVAMFITKQDSGIQSLAQLKGKRVVVGPSGAGFEMFVGPLLEGHGVTYDDFSPMNNTQSGAVDLLADGNADAAFLGGAVPTGSIIQACSSHDIFFIPFDAKVRETLVEQYDFFQPFTVTKDKYSDLTDDFAGLNVGSMHLITSASEDEERVYQLTKTIWEHRAAIASKHPAGKAINEKNAARFTGTEFHPGAIRFYKEIKIWPEEAVADAASESAPAAAAADGETPAAPEASADASKEDAGKEK